MKWLHKRCIVCVYIYIYIYIYTHTHKHASEPQVQPPEVDPAGFLDRQRKEPARFSSTPSLSLALSPSPSPSLSGSRSLSPSLSLSIWLSLSGSLSGSLRLPLWLSPSTSISTSTSTAPPLSHMYVTACMSGACMYGHNIHIHHTCTCDNVSIDSFLCNGNPPGVGMGSHLSGTTLPDVRHGAVSNMNTALPFQPTAFLKVVLNKVSAKASM